MSLQRAFGSGAVAAGLALVASFWVPPFSGGEAPSAARDAGCGKMSALEPGRAFPPPPGDHQGLFGRSHEPETAGTSELQSPSPPAPRPPLSSPHPSTQESANLEALFVQQAPVAGSQLDSPAPHAVGVHREAAVRAVSTALIRPDRQDDRLNEAIDLIPAMLHGRVLG